MFHQTSLRCGGVRRTHGSHWTLISSTRRSSQLSPDGWALLRSKQMRIWLDSWQFDWFEPSWLLIIDHAVENRKEGLTMNIFSNVDVKFLAIICTIFVITCEISNTIQYLFAWLLQLARLERIGGNKSACLLTLISRSVMPLKFVSRITTQLSTCPLMNSTSATFTSRLQIADKYTSSGV